MKLLFLDQQMFSQDGNGGEVLASDGLSLANGGSLGSGGVCGGSAKKKETLGRNQSSHTHMLESVRCFSIRELNVFVTHFSGRAELQSSDL